MKLGRKPAATAAGSALPTVSAETALTVGGSALLVAGSDPPRLTSKDSGGVWYGGPFSRSKATSVGSAATYTPTYQTPFTVANSLGVPIVRTGRLTFTTARALGNGRDIRIERLVSGQTPQALARFVSSVRQVSGGYEYTLFFPLSLAANATGNFRATYGDPAAPDAVFGAAEIASLATYAQGRAIGDMWVYLDRAQAYVPADFAGAGIQILGARDDQSNEVALDGRSVIWNGVDYASLFHYSNGGLRFGEAGGGSGGSRTANDLQFLTGDAYESWRRQITLPDGLAWHILTGGSGYTADIRATIRYVFPGKWIVTVLSRVDRGLISILSARVANMEFTQAIPASIPEGDPNGPYVLVADPAGVTGVAGAEAPL